MDVFSSLAQQMLSDQEHVSGVKARIASVERAETRFAAYLKAATSPAEMESRLAFQMPAIRQSVKQACAEYDYDDAESMIGEVVSHLKQAWNFDKKKGDDDSDSDDDKPKADKSDDDEDDKPDFLKKDDDKDDDDDDSKESSVKLAIVTGDLVVVTEGDNKGKSGVVQSVNKEHGDATVEFEGGGRSGVKLESLRVESSVKTAGDWELIDKTDNDSHDTGSKEEVLEMAAQRNEKEPGKWVAKPEGYAEKNWKGASARLSDRHDADSDFHTPDCCQNCRKEQPAGSMDKPGSHEGLCPECAKRLDEQKNAAVKTADGVAMPDMKTQHERIDPKGTAGPTPKIDKSRVPADGLKPIDVGSKVHPSTHMDPATGPFEGQEDSLEQNKPREPMSVSEMVNPEKTMQPDSLDTSGQGGTYNNKATETTNPVTSKFHLED